MLEQLFPKQLNNDYQGSLFAKYIFALLTILTIGRSLFHMFATDGGAQSVASIPLNEYGHAASVTVILIFALWGLSQCLMGIIYLVTLWRYQRLIPLLYLLMFVEYGMRIILFHIKPIVTLHVAPGTIVDKIMFPLTLLLFFMSIRKRKLKIDQ
jgi:hypothetical protein